MSKKERFMNPKVKKAWVKALRSGKYKKCKDWLVDTNKKGEIVRYDVIGVLTDLYAKAKKLKVKTHEYQNLFFHLPHPLLDDLDGEPRMTAVPEVLEWAGVRPNFDLVRYKGADYALAELNDGNHVTGAKPLSFNALADVIEAQD